MSFSNGIILATLIGVVVVGSACTQEAVEDPANGTAIAVDEVKEAGENTADDSKSIAERTKEIAGQTADKTREIVVGVGSATKEIVSTTGETITDSWITAKVRAKFVDETLLEGSNVDVDTNSYVVTLKGRVSSDAAKARAAAIAGGTEGVTRVVNELVVRS